MSGHSAGQGETTSQLKGVIKLSYNADGRPRVPTKEYLGSINVKGAQNLLRSYVRDHWSEFKSITILASSSHINPGLYTNRSKGTPPWTRIASDPAAYLHASSIVAGLPFPKDPAKIHENDLNAWLDHWRKLEAKNGTGLKFIWNVSKEHKGKQRTKHLTSEEESAEDEDDSDSSDTAESVDSDGNDSWPTRRHKDGNTDNDEHIAHGSR